MWRPARSSPTSAAGRCRSSTPAGGCSPSTPPSATPSGCSTSPISGRRRSAGPGAAALVDAGLTNDLARIGPGQAQYTLCCVPTASPTRRRRRRPDRLPARRRRRPARAQRGQRRGGARPAGRRRTGRGHGDRPARGDRRPGGPGAAVAGGAGRGGPGRRAALHVVHGTGGTGDDVTVCRTGYTGEHGYELLVAADRAGELWDELLRAGPTRASAPAGWAPGTRCAPRWAIRCTATSSRWRSARPGARRLGGRLAEAGVLGPGRVARREGGRSGAAAVGPARHGPGHSAARGWRSWTATAPGSARSPAARSRRRCAPASRSPCSTRRPAPPMTRAHRRRPRPAADRRGRQAAVRRPSAVR